MSKIWQKQVTIIDKQLSQNQDENLNAAIENVRKEESAKRKRKGKNVVEQEKNTTKKKSGVKQKKRKLVPKPMFNSKKKKRVAVNEVETNDVIADDSSTDSEISCSYQHSDMVGSYKEETDGRYFKEGWDLYEVKCVHCGVMFKDSGNDKCYCVSKKKPIYICVGRMSHRCKHAFCNDCYQKKNSGTGTRKRSSNRVRNKT